MADPRDDGTPTWVDPEDHPGSMRYGPLGRHDIGGDTDSEGVESWRGRRDSGGAAGRRGSCATVPSGVLPRGFYEMPKVDWCRPPIPGWAPDWAAVRQLEEMGVGWYLEQYDLYPKCDKRPEDFPLGPNGEKPKKWDGNGGQSAYGRAVECVDEYARRGWNPDVARPWERADGGRGGKGPGSRGGGSPGGRGGGDPATRIDGWWGPFGPAGGPMGGAGEAGHMGPIGGGGGGQDCCCRCCDGHQLGTPGPGTIATPTAKTAGQTLDPYRPTLPDGRVRTTEWVFMPSAAEVAAKAVRTTVPMESSTQVEPAQGKCGCCCCDSKECPGGADPSGPSTRAAITDQRPGTATVDDVGRSPLLDGRAFFEPPAPAEDPDEEEGEDDPCKGLRLEDFRRKALEGVSVDPETLNYKDGKSASDVNRLITERYGRLYMRNPDAFKWVGAACLVSTNVGRGMEMMLKLGKWSGEKGPLDAYKGLRDGNLAVFADVYPVFLAYESLGIDCLKVMLKDGPKQDLLRGFELLDRGVKSGNAEDVWEGNKQILKYEQKHTLQEHAYGKYAEALDIAAKYQPKPPFPGPRVWPVAMPGKRLSNFDDRWKYIEEEILPAWQAIDSDRHRAFELVQEAITEFSIKRVWKRK